MGRGYAYSVRGIRCEDGIFKSERVGLLHSSLADDTLTREGDKPMEDLLALLWSVYQSTVAILDGLIDGLQ